MKPFTLRSNAWLGRWMIAAVSLVGLAGIAQAADDAQPQAALTTVSSLAPNLRPQNVPLDYVITPNGYFAASCVHAVSQGEKVHNDGSIEALDGSIRKTAACTQPHFTQSGVRIEANDGEDWQLGIVGIDGPEVDQADRLRHSPLEDHMRFVNDRRAV